LVVTEALLQGVLDAEVLFLELLGEGFEEHQTPLLYFSEAGPQ
jgi:hypothetical protein